MEPMLEFIGDVQVFESISTPDPQPIEGLTIDEYSRVLAALSRVRKEQRTQAAVAVAGSRERQVVGHPKGMQRTAVKIVGSSDRIPVRGLPEAKRKPVRIC